MQRREEAINECLWDSKLNTWADLNLITNKLHTDYLYITDLAPLWFNVRPKVDPKIILARYDSLLMSHVSGKNLVLLEKKKVFYKQLFKIKEFLHRIYTPVNNGTFLTYGLPIIHGWWIIYVRMSLAILSLLT